MLNTDEEIEREEEICFLDMEFPPDLADEGTGPVDDPAALIAAKATTMQPEMTQVQVIAFAQFVHHNKLPSKDQLIEQLRIAHPTITSSRAQATRKLDSIAIKQRNPAGGTVWVVKEETLKELDLSDLMAMKLEEPPVKELKSAKKSIPKEEVSAETTASLTPPVNVKDDAKQVVKIHKQGRKDAKVSDRKYKTPVKPTESKLSKKAKIDTSKRESPTGPTVGSTEVRAKKRQAAAGSAQLFASFLAGKKQRTADAS